MKKKIFFLLPILLLSLILGGCGPKTANTVNSPGPTVKETVATVTGFDAQLRGGADGKCYSNMLELDIRAKNWLADKKNINKTVPLTFVKWVKAFQIPEPICPDKGKYTMDSKGTIVCSIHGKLKELQTKVETAGTMTPGGADSAYKITIGKFVTESFLNNLKNAYKLPADAAKVIDSYALLNGMLYPIEASGFAEPDGFKIDGNKLVLVGTNFITSITFKKVGDKWLMDDLEFNTAYLNKTTGKK